MYGPLFDSMHGARWLLSASPVSVSGGAIANALTLPSSTGRTQSADGGESAVTPPQLLIPVMLGGSAPSVYVTLNLGPAEAEMGWPKTTGLL